MGSEGMIRAALRRLLMGIAAAIVAGASSASHAYLNDLARLGTADAVRTLVYSIGLDATFRVVAGRTLQETSYALGATGPIVVNAVTNKAYIGGSGQVVEFDGASRTATGIGSTGTPTAMALNVATNMLYVAHSDATLAVVDLDTRAVTNVTLTAPAVGIGVNPATNKVYLSGTTVQVLDGATNTVVPIGVTAKGGTVAVNAAANKVYIITVDDGSGPHTLTIIDGATNGSTTVDTAQYPLTLAVNPLTGRIYVGAGGLGNVSPTVTVLDGDTLARTDVVLGLGSPVRGLAVSSTTNKIYANGPEVCSTVCPGSVVATIDGVTNVATPGPFSAIGNVTVDPSANRLYSHAVVMGPLGRTNFLWGSTDVSVTPAPTTINPPTTTVTPLPGDAATTSTPRFTFTTGAGLGGMPALAVFFSVDSATGPWTRATGSAPNFSGRASALADGVHTLYAFAVDASISGFDAYHGTSVAGQATSYAFTVANACGAAPCADIGVARTSVPAAGLTGRDAVYKLHVVNDGASPATSLTLTETIPADAQFVWSSPGCMALGNTVTCAFGTMASGAGADVTIVMRPGSAGTATNTATVSAAELDPQTDNNTSTANVPVAASPAASIVWRYRLYSPFTLEHLFTTDLNEYTVLGQYGWSQEGTSGRVLDNPGSFNGVTATPYYRLYNAGVQWHHWTTDANEYYTLVQYPGWNGEGIDGFILPVPTAGATELYRLNYPHIPGLHHWTIDANEYSTLTTSYGWIGEGGAGFVIQ